jgi:aspartate racemase
MTDPSGERILGIVGGTGPESTIDYYRSLIRTWRQRRPDGSYPRVIINSIEAGRVFANLGTADYAAVGRDLGPAVAALAAAGCQRALLASNASHLAFELIEPPPAIPLIHIVDAARDAAVSAGYRRLGLIGTRFVMESDLYPARLAPAGLEVVLPTPDEREKVHAIYFGELVDGVIRDESRDALRKVVVAMRQRDGIDAIVLGGTELALIITESTFAGVPVLNTAQVQVDAAVDWLLSG